MARARKPLTGAAVVALVLAGTLPVGARTVRVSGPSPYADCRVPLFKGERHYVNAEVEPWVAVDPSSSQHLVGVWQQDRFSFGGASGLASGYSLDGGQTWTETTLPLDACVQGGLPYDRASDPWVSIGPDGIVYAVSISFDVHGPDNVVAATTSSDGGATWSPPAIVHANLGTEGREWFDDKESVTADPTRPGVAYVVWDRTNEGADEGGVAHDVGRPARIAGPASGISAPVWFSMTTDGGQTWSAARAIFDMGPGHQTIGSQIVADPTSGTLYDVFDYFHDGLYYESVIRSTDGGARWSDPVQISRDRSRGVKDPNTGKRLRTGFGLPDAAVDPRSGTLYVTWQDARFSHGRRDEIALTRSVDGGQTWSPPARVSTKTGLPAFTPSVEVSSDGTVGVTYYDLRNLKNQTSTLPTDSWLVRLQEDGRTRIDETHLAGPFDHLIAPFAGGFFLGDYEGLATAGTTFEAFFVKANTGREHNRTDVVTAAV